MIRARLPVTSLPVLFVLVIACNLPEARPTDLPDGARCEAARECASGDCTTHGTCSGKRCYDVSCDPGWRCVTYEPSLLSNGTKRCEATCAACPDGTHCPAGADTGALCVDGPARAGSIDGPRSVKITSRHAFTARFEPPLPEDAHVSWFVSPEGGPGQQASSVASGNPVELTFDGQFIAVNVAGEYRLRAEARKYDSKTGATEHAEVEVPLTVSCLAGGETCKADRFAPTYCCAPGLYCPGSADENAPRVCAPRD